MFVRTSLCNILAFLHTVLHTLGYCIALWDVEAILGSGIHAECKEGCVVTQMKDSMLKSKKGKASYRETFDYEADSTEGGTWGAGLSPLSS